MGKIADISKYQGAVDWAKATKELDFVILRASCGDNADTKYYDNVNGCVANGVPFGAYHYVKAGTATAAVKEAQKFVEVCTKAQRQPNFWIADIEYDAQTKSTTEAVCVAFLNTLRAFGCQKIGLYINTRYKWAGAAIALCDIMWIPHWGKNDSNIPADTYKPDRPHDLWQYTSKGTLSGVMGNVDLNQISGDKPLSYFTEPPESAPASEDGEKGSEPTMSYDPKKVIDIALAEVGYLEKETNAQLNDKIANAGDENYTKYGRDLDALGFYNGRKNGVAWCDQFVDWSFVEAYGMDVALALTFQPYGKPNCGAGCKYSREYYRKNGHLFDNPVPGDQIFFYGKTDGKVDKSKISHTGLVYDVDSKYVYTVEGNTSSASGVVANGGAVEKKKYKLNYDRLAGFGRPAWGIQGGDIPVDPQPVEPETPTEYKLGERTLRKGDEGSDVKEMQSLFIGLGYDLGSSGADGDFGSKTERGVKAFQDDKNLAVDGVYGKKTHAALMAAIVPWPTTTPDSNPAPVPEPVPPATDTKWLTITGNSVNARVGDSKEYDSVGHLHNGDTIEYVVTAPNGWNAGRWKNRIVWVSPDYSMITVG